MCELFDIEHKGAKYHCPFHKDNTPSASAKNGKFHCFSCGFHGDIFDLAQKMGMDKNSLATSFGYNFYSRIINKKEFEKIQKQRQKNEQLKELSQYQIQKLIDCRRWFYLKTMDDNFPPVAYIDRLLESKKFPIESDVIALINSLYERYKNEVKA